MKKRLLSMLLCLCMALSLLPASAFAAGGKETLFDRYIPINNAYSAGISYPNPKVDQVFSFQIGTRFVDENYGSTMFAKELKRSAYQGYFLKLTYKGTFGSMNKTDAMNIFYKDETSYKIAMGQMEPTGNYSRNILKNTIIVSIDLYDANKKLVQNVSPAAAIMAAGPDGEFLTFSQKGGKACSIYFSTQDNIFKGSADKRNDSLASFTVVSAWPTSKSEVEGLLGSGGGSEPAPTYKFIQYPELTGKPQYMTNDIISGSEFIDPFGTYYQVGKDPKGGIDPVVRNKIPNVVDYSEYPLSITAGNTRRSILTADGTLYGVTSEYEKTVLATGVKQAGKAHYMTADGTVREIVSGKVVATNCKSFAEHRYAKVIGVLKNDGTAWLGYTYLADPVGYEKGLSKVLSSAKAVVAGGVCGQDGKFYRWDEEVLYLGYDEKLFAQGIFKEKRDYILSLDLMTDKAARVFPYEYFTAQESTAEDAMTGFVVNEDGYIWGFGLQNEFALGKLGMVKHVFPIYQHAGLGTYDNGNFVGFLPEDNKTTYALVANHCSMNRPKVGEFPVDYLTDVPGGFRATDGYAYAFDNDADDGSIDRVFRMKPTEFHYLNDGTEIFKALNTTTNPVGSLYLLPNVARSSYGTDQRHDSVVLLERTDGSMWMTQLYPRATAAATVAKLGGWECSNAIQITQPTTKRSGRVDYIDLVGGDGSIVMNHGPVEAAEDNTFPTYVESDRYVNISVSRAERMYQNGQRFALFVTTSECGWSKRLKSGVPGVLEETGAKIYGITDDYGVLNFQWDFVKGDTLGTPYMVLVNGVNKVEVIPAIHTADQLRQALNKAKIMGIPEADSAASLNPVSPTTPGKLPSDKLSVSAYEWEVLRIVNRERFAEGLHALAMPGALQTATDVRENELATLFSHTRPNGQTASTAIPSSFKSGAGGENIASGQRDPAEAMSGWMNSPGHRANILNTDFDYLGVGYLNSKPTRWVQMFSDAPGFTNVTSSSGSLTFASEDAMKNEYLICTDKNGVESYLPIDTNVMTKSGNTYTLKLSGKTVTLTVGAVQPAIPAAGTAYTLQQTAVLDGKEVAFDTYALKDANGNGTNYMKIRDLAYVLNGSKGQFALGYDAGSISFKSKTPYVPNGTEMKVPFTGDQPYFVTPGTFLVDGVKKELTTISILDAAGNGYTYIKVRDLAQALNFYVGWNGKIVIDTGKPYEG